jgi:hypothetical protein
MKVVELMKKRLFTIDLNFDTSESLIFQNKKCFFLISKTILLTLLHRPSFYSSYPFHNLSRGLPVLSSHRFDYLSVLMKCVFISTGSFSEVHKNLMDFLCYFFVPILCIGIMRKEAS